MRTGTKLGAYGAGLVIVLGGGAGLGAAAGPIDGPGNDHKVDAAGDDHQATDTTTPVEPVTCTVEVPDVPSAPTGDHADHVKCCEVETMPWVMGGPGWVSRAVA